MVLQHWGLSQWHRLLLGCLVAVLLLVRCQAGCLLPLCLLAEGLLLLLRLLLLLKAQACWLLAPPAPAQAGAAWVHPAAPVSQVLWACWALLPGRKEGLPGLAPAVSHHLLPLLLLGHPVWRVLLVMALWEAMVLCQACAGWLSWGQVPACYLGACTGLQHLQAAHSTDSGRLCDTQAPSEQDHA
jgi:hypothetical protein